MSRRTRARGSETNQEFVSDENSLTTAIVERIADLEDMDPIDLTPPLYRKVDPDALLALFDDQRDGSNGDVRVEFTYCGYDVVVEGADNVRIRGE